MDEELLILKLGGVPDISHINLDDLMILLHESGYVYRQTFSYKQQWVAGKSFSLRASDKVYNFNINDCVYIVYNSV